MSDPLSPPVTYEAYNPATDEAPGGGDADCDGIGEMAKRSKAKPKAKAKR
jgi:hypothetical protein